MAGTKTKGPVQLFSAICCLTSRPSSHLLPKDAMRSQRSCWLGRPNELSVQGQPGRQGHHQGLAHLPHGGHLQGLVSTLQNLESSPLGVRESLHSMLPSGNYAPQTWVSDSFTPRLYDLGQVISHETPFLHCEMGIINLPCRGTTGFTCNST